MLAAMTAEPNVTGGDGLGVLIELGGGGYASVRGLFAGLEV